MLNIFSGFLRGAVCRSSIIFCLSSICFGVLAQQAASPSNSELEAGARGGNKESQAELGFRLLLGTGITRDPKKAVEWLERAAAQGDFKAQRAMGYAYASGLGVEKDFGKARSFYELAAASGDLEAINNLGLMALRGEGREVSLADAETYFKRAIDKGHVSSMLPLGLSLIGSNDKPGRDLQEGIGWIRRGARAGHTPAALSLFKIYASGIPGLLKDEAEAAKWLSLAAHAGNAEAQYTLSIAHRNGQYQLARNPREAYFWGSLASNQTYPLAMLLRSELEQAITPAEIADTQQQIRTWKVKSTKDDRQGLVPLTNLKLKYKFESIQLTKENFNEAAKKCMASYPQSAIERFLIDWKVPFKNSTTILGHRDAASALVIKESTAICVAESEAGFPVWAGEAIELTVEPDGVPVTVKEDWYTQISEIIARKGYADIVFQYPNGNAFVSTFKTIPRNLISLDYRAVFRRAGEYDPSRYDRIFTHPDLKSVKTTQYGSLFQKNILQHRFQPTPVGSGAPAAAPALFPPLTTGHQL